MFRHVAAFELRYQLRSPVFWTTALLFALLTFGAITSDQVQIGSGGNVKRNSPYAIAHTLVIMSIFAIFIMAAFVSNVVVRDDETGYRPDRPFDARVDVRLSVRPVHRRLRRRLPGLCRACRSAMLIGSFMPWIDPETLGPFRPGDYVYVYFVLCVPTLFVMGAVLFRACDDDAFDAGDLRRRRCAADDLLRLDRVLPAARVRADRRAGRTVRDRRLHAGDEILDGGGA